MFSKTFTVKSNSKIKASERAAVAVGYTAMSGYDIFMSGGCGKAVLVHHVLGDHLCALNTTVTRPILPWDVSPNECPVGDAIHSLPPVQDDQCPPELTPSLDNDTPSENDPDTILRDCFLRSIKIMKDKELPMPVNVFYARHILPQRPEGDLDVRKTTYKKVGKFLQEMERAGFISLENKSSVFHLRTINHEHPDLLSLKIPAKIGIETSEAKIEWPDGYRGPPTIEENLIVNGPFREIVSEVGIEQNSFISCSEARKVLDKYVRLKNLQCPKDPSLVSLNPVLMKLCNPSYYVETPESTLAKPIFFIRFQDIFSSVHKKLQKVHLITPAEGVGSPVVWQKKNLPQIQLNMVTRNGKKMTRITNLNIFSIDVDAFIKHLKIQLACSVGRSDELPDTIQAQGSHEAALSKILAGHPQGTQTLVHMTTMLRSLHQTSQKVQKFKYFLVLDFEATCERGKKLNPMEVIEFPVIKVNSRTLTPESEFHHYVRPKVHSELSSFCTELTGIIQDMVDNQPYLEAVLKLFDDYLKQEGLLTSDENEFAFVTCGDWDLKTLLPSQCRHSGIPVPSYFKRWINVKQVYTDVMGQFPHGMPYMLTGLGLQLRGRHHSGIDDTRNIASILCELIHRGAVPGITGSIS